eukprot:677887-Rhodomonas_salina.2
MLSKISITLIFGHYKGCHRTGIVGSSARLLEPSMRSHPTAPAQVKFVPLAQSLRVVLGFPRDSCLPQLERHRYPGIRTRGGIPTRRSVQVLRSVPTRRRSPESLRKVLYPGTGRGTRRDTQLGEAS